MIPGTWYLVHTIFDQPAPTKFGTKAVTVMHSPNPRCVQNLKLLASMVAEICRGSQKAQSPANFGSEVFWQATPRTQVV